jgi:hypothetical protein
MKGYRGDRGELEHKHKKKNAPKQKACHNKARHQKTHHRHKAKTAHKGGTRKKTAARAGGSQRAHCAVSVKNVRPPSFQCLSYYFVNASTPLLQRYT